MFQQMLAVWSLVPSAFSKSSLNIWKFSVHVLLKPGFENSEHYFASMRWVQLCSSLNILWYCLSLWLEWKLTFSNPVATSEFSRFAGILSTALSEHHLLGWNSSTGIPSPPLALFVVMLPKAHLTSHSRMSASRWVITPLWLSGSLRSFLYCFSVYSCQLFLIYLLLLVVPYYFCPVLCPSLHDMFPRYL